MSWAKRGEDSLVIRFIPRIKNRSATMFNCFLQAKNAEKGKKT
ncbi:hypothetical protein M493_05840 [Geobacillus genomosp. 3]|uniref:Uncharacterized protein n=1 Tax=Geobacillus genomosp. 3 TaxID=1921421 RepID=S6A114_GEOG3|nr:hypothetical protein M493_05840 [Geobacillus genomosp. 3]